MTHPKCRFCDNRLEHCFVDLGNAPLSNSYLRESELSRSEPRYPLRAYICSKCFLVNVEQFESPASIFSEYAYFSSYSDTWLKHCETYAGQMVERFALNGESMVLELGSNDGCMLRCFKNSGIPVLGIDPARNVATVAQSAGIPTIAEFFGTACAERLAMEGRQADLLVANNVLAHVPDLNDFVKGMKRILNGSGVMTIEFPHLMRLIEDCEFDTIYHEHFSYFSFGTARQILESHGFVVFDVEELDTHGGSLRVFASHRENEELEVCDKVAAMLAREEKFGMSRLELYTSFGRKVAALKTRLTAVLKELKRSGKHIVGYGAPAKGNTLLNYCGIGTDIIDYTVDRSPHKQGLWMPGSRLPIFAPDRIRETKPDYVLILPWNIKDEVMRQIGYIREWGGQFIVPIPDVAIKE